MNKWEAVEEACRQFMEWIESDEYCEDELDDYEHNVYEAAMEAVFGEAIWDRVNAVMMGE